MRKKGSIEKEMLQMYSEKGKMFKTYLLFIKLKRSLRIKIGKLGFLKFEKGNYIYVGSANNGLKFRIRRHLRRRKKKFWHIDYLSVKSDVDIFKVVVSEDISECEMVRYLSGELVPIKKFGSSDCDCQGHLFRYNKKVLFLRRFKCYEYGD